MRMLHYSQYDREIENGPLLWMRTTERLDIEEIVDKWNDKRNACMLFAINSLSHPFFQ